MAALTISVDETTWAILSKAAEERGATPADLASNAVSEECRKERNARGWTDADLAGYPQADLLSEPSARITIPQGWPEWIDVRTPEGCAAIARHGGFRVYVDGKRLRHPVSYDTRRGRVVAYQTMTDGSPRTIPGTATIATYDVEGDVEIRASAHKPGA